MVTVAKLTGDGVMMCRFGWRTPERMTPNAPLAEGVDPRSH
jgi:hypothetical protein